MVRPRGSCLLVVVEDDASVRTVLRDVWEDEVGLDVVMATNGLEAKDLLSDLPAAPCVIVLDLVMPHLGGREVLAWLRGPESPFPSVPVFVISADRDEIDEVRRTHGVPAFQKPFDLDRLLVAARELCVPDGD